MTLVNCFDFDGVTSLGLCPGPNDVVVTGRPIDEFKVVYDFLASRGISVPVYFNTTTLEKRGTGTPYSRLSSALHKARTIVSLVNGGVSIGLIFEDDPEQIRIMKDYFADNLPELSARIVHINHNGQVAY